MLTLAKAVDVRDTEAVKALVDEVDQDSGTIDVIMMNFGKPPQWLAIYGSHPGLWPQSVVFKIFDSYKFTHYLLPMMQNQKSGTVILAATAGAHSNADCSSYTASKLARVCQAKIIHAKSFQ